MQVTPAEAQPGRKVHMLELWHGVTLAFKDLGLQVRAGCAPRYRKKSALNNCSTTRLYLSSLSNWYRVDNSKKKGGLAKRVPIYFPFLSYAHQITGHVFDYILKKRDERVTLLVGAKCARAISLCICKWYAPDRTCGEESCFRSE